MNFIILISLFISLATSCLGQSQAEMNEEAVNRLAKLDAKLNETYKANLQAHSDNESYVNDLKEAQRAWLKYVEFHLKTQFPLREGENIREVYGTAYPSELAETKSALISQRIVELGGEITADKHMEDGRGKVGEDDPKSGEVANKTEAVVEQAINPDDKIQLLGLWVVRHTNAVQMVTKYRNAGPDIIKAFRGTLSTLDDFGEVSAKETQEYTTATIRTDRREQHALKPGEIFYIDRTIFDGNQPDNLVVVDVNSLTDMLKVKHESDLGKIRFSNQRLRFKVDKIVVGE